MAAKLAFGISIKMLGMVNTQIRSKMECMIADSFVFAPAFIFAELLTITAVTGNAPINPQSVFPIPCAINYLFVLEVRFFGSNLSVASTLSNDSKLATMASVTTTVQNFDEGIKL